MSEVIIPSGCESWKRIIVLNLVPSIPDQTPNMKYKVAISLWLVDINHRLILIFSKRLKLFAFYYAILIYIFLF